MVYLNLRDQNLKNKTKIHKLDSINKLPKNIKPSNDGFFFEFKTTKASINLCYKTLFKKKLQKNLDTIKTYITFGRPINWYTNFINK